jgi:hypothetical protein
MWLYCLLAQIARSDSVYKTIKGCDVWDIERDARKWLGGMPCIAHPPCRAWGQLSHMAKPRSDEKDLARYAVEQVRTWGGVLEHPLASKLWADQSLPNIGAYDKHGGATIAISQHWFGHRAEKKTLLYIVGCELGKLPIMPMKLGDATHVINGLRKGMHGWRPEVSKAEREHTPIKLAHWLFSTASRCATTARENV